MRLIIISRSSKPRPLPAAATPCAGVKMLAKVMLFHISLESAWRETHITFHYTFIANTGCAELGILGATTCTQPLAVNPYVQYVAYRIVRADVMRQYRALT